MKELNVTLVGCGKMGGALLRGWLALKNVGTIHVIEPNTLPDDLEERRFILHTSIEAYNETKPASGLFVMAVKPQMMEAACNALRENVPPAALILSIAAGKTIAFFEKQFGPNQPVIRTMPNTPAAIGKGITVAVANKHATILQRQQAGDLLKATGFVEWIEDETLLDAVTAVSGSGPAYVFLLIEAMTNAGVKVGLPQNLAEKLARQTVIGAAALAEQDKNLEPATLRKNVTSPGGTTEAALKVLLAAGGLNEIMSAAVQSARDKGVELGR